MCLTRWRRELRLRAPPGIPQAGGSAYRQLFLILLSLSAGPWAVDSIQDGNASVQRLQAQPGIP